MAKLIENNHANPLTSDVEAIDAAGLDYGAYDKNNYLFDLLQDVWGYAVGGDSNLGDSQRVDNRSKAEDYAKQFFDDNTGTYGLGTDGQLMQGGTAFDMEGNDGNAGTYNLGKDI